MTTRRTRAVEGQSGIDTLALTAKAVGHQTYKCENGAWAHKGPTAVLLNVKGDTIGTHFAGPSWKLNLPNDTSTVVGKTSASVNASSAGAIQWLLLDGNGARDGKGIFGRVLKIHRLETNGGQKPLGGCDASCNGQEIQIPYTATYYFYIQR